MRRRKRLLAASPEVRSRHALFARDGVAAARLLDAGDVTTRFMLGATTTTSYLDCPRCGALVASGYRMTHLACPYCRVTICEAAGQI